AVVQLIEVLHLTGSRARIHVDHEVMRVEIESAMGDDLPTMVLSQAAKDLEEATGLRVRTKVRRTKSIGKSPAPVQKVTR
ncbi:MAG: hypothetical protein OK441_06635, partial [Thaumarchaeota archaeon]|nr:hypothetical protein [Nitrososphaerota archaeon]